MASIALGKNIFLKQITDENFFLFNSINKKSYEIGKNDFETLQTMKEEQSFEDLYYKNRSRMTREQLTEFCKEVDKLGFLKGSKTEKQFKLTLIKLGLFNPSLYFTQESGFIKFMYFLLTKGPVIALLMGILSFFFARTDGILNRISAFQISTGNVVFSLLMTFLVVMVHELGHMSMAIHYGVPVPEVGVMLYWFAPCAYADVSATHFMNDKGKKIQVLLAGVYTHIIWVGLGLVTFNMLPSLVDYTIPFIVMNLGLIFLNVTFYLKLDGYYILTSIFDEPLLREHSMAMLVNKSVREQLKQKANYSEFLLYCVIAFVSFIYIPSLVMSGILRVIPMFIR